MKHPTADQIVAAFETNGYRYYKNGRINPFGIRASNRDSGTFDDILGFLYFDSGRAIVKTYLGTTDPGTYYLVQRLLDPDGCAILVPNQWRNAYVVAKHQGKYDALCQRGSKVSVFRDKDRDKVLEMDPASIETGWFGINVHYDAYSSENESNILYKASAGCQVFARRADFHEFMAAVKKSRQAYENVFDYTLLREEDFDALTDTSVDIQTDTHGITCPNCGHQFSAAGLLEHSDSDDQSEANLDQDELNFGFADESALETSIELGPEKHGLIARWKTLRITRLEEAAKKKAKAVVRNRERYEEVAEECGRVPWYLIGIIHTLEADQNFEKHLHNGDSLKKRTVRVPSGRPKSGSAPFTWEESALDAIQMKRWHEWKDWRIIEILDRMERYNGTGYRRHHPDVPSPYLWSGSQHYKQGKYVADGKWSDTAVSKQVGGAVLLKLILEEIGIEVFD